MGKKRSPRKPARPAPQARPAAGRSASTAAPARFGRRVPVLPALAAVAVIALGGWWWLRAPAFTLGSEATRNVLLVTIDTLRADALGSYGGHAITPNLDDARRPRRALHVRALPRGRHARVPYEHPHRPLSVRARHPRQHGLSAVARRSRRRPRVSRNGASRPARSSAAFRSTGGSGWAPASTSTTTASARSDRAWTCCVRERRADVVVKARRWTGSARQPGKWFAWVHVFDPHAPYKPPGGVGRRASPPIPISARCRGPMPRSVRSSIGWPHSHARRSSSSRRTTARASASTAS